MEDGAAAIETIALTKRFGAVMAVDQLDLRVGAGEVFGFLGPNGAGKTTTIRLLLDVLRPTAGSAQVLGRSVADPATRSRIGYLPSELHLDRRHTVQETLDFLGALRDGFDSQMQSALLERFDLDPTRRIGELSTGNRRKVGVVQAFATRPELLILDEPTSGLDPLLQHEFLLLVRESACSGAPPCSSRRTCSPRSNASADRVGILREGRLVALGTVDDLRARARQRLDLHFGEPVDPDAFRGVPGVAEVSTGDDGKTISVVVEGSVDALIKAAASYTVDRVVTHDTDLEDVFLDLYRSPL